MARIVIVEDDRDIRELIALILDEDGHTTVATATGPEALQACGTPYPTWCCSTSACPAS